MSITCRPTTRRRPVPHRLRHRRHVLEVYADFSGTGRNYTYFPDRQTHRVFLEDLRNEGRSRSA